MKYTVKLSKAKDSTSADLVIKTNDGKKTFGKKIVFEILDASYIEMLYKVSKLEQEFDPEDPLSMVTYFGESVEVIKDFLGESTYRALNDFAKENDDSFKFTDFFDATKQYGEEIQKESDKAKK